MLLSEPSPRKAKNLESVILSEVSQTEKEKYHMTSLICGKRNDTNELTKQKETHRLREQTWLPARRMRRRNS